MLFLLPCTSIRGHVQYRRPKLVSRRSRSACPVCRPSEGKWLCNESVAFYILTRSASIVTALPEMTSDNGMVVSRSGIVSRPTLPTTRGRLVITGQPRTVTSGMRGAATLMANSSIVQVGS